MLPYLRLVAAVIASLVMPAPVAAQGTFDVKELAAYRLTAARLAPFEEASRLIADVIESDPGLTNAPLFTKEITLSGDAPVMAAELHARLTAHPALAQALRTAKISAREYATFALALIAARLAHGFADAGILRVPPGVAADNVAFVSAHHDRVVAVLKRLGVEH
jgi:hypothetical protein